MNKLIIVGNGFDLAHGLKTSYNDFAKYYKNNLVLIKFHELVDKIGSSIPIYDIDGNIKDITWYSFEENIERITQYIFQKNFDDNLSQDDYHHIENEMKEANELFFNYLDYSFNI